MPQEHASNVISSKLEGKQFAIFLCLCLMGLLVGYLVLARPDRFTRLIEGSD